MANVGFKRGTAAALQTLMSQNSVSTPKFIEGTFYLTTDTDKLYFAQSNSELVDLNQYIRIWNSNTALPTTADAPLQVGDIYYWEPRNILAIVDSVSGNTVEWTQLNTDTHLIANNTTTIQVGTTTNGGTVTTYVADSAQTPNVATGSFSIIGGSNVTVTPDATNKTLTIAASQSLDHTYKLTTTSSSNDAKINLYDDLASGNVANSTITIKGAASGSIASVSSDSARNVTITVPERPVTQVGAAFNAVGTLSISAQTADNVTPASATVTPIITYGQGSTPDEAKFLSGTAHLNIYSKSEIDSLLTNQTAAFDAMTYKGVIDSQAAANTKLVSSANVGDTYKMGLDITTPVTAQTGDLVIAKGTDGNVTWDVVPSGDDQSITGIVSGNSLAIQDNGSTIAGITLAESSDTTKAKIVLTNSQSGNINTITLSHGTAGTAQTKLGSASGETAYTAVAAGTTQSAATGSDSSSTLDIPTIKGISYDAAGHIVSVTTGTYRVIDSHANISNVTLSISSGLTAFSGTEDSNKRAVVNVGVTDTDSATKVGSVAFSTSQNSALSITQTSVNISSNSVPTVMIDLVWGSF